MVKILVTGGAGNIGASLTRRLVSDSENFVVVADNLMTGDSTKIPLERSNCKFVKADVNELSDISRVMHTERFDYVFHYAAVVGVQRTLAKPMLVLKDIDGIKNILNLSKDTGVKHVYYSSSSEVYGEPVEIPQNELTTPLNSRLPYAIVKNVGEAYFKSFHQEYGLNYTIFRFFNTYGPLQTSDFVITKFIQAALENRPITVYGDGSQTRTFCYIDDNLDLTLKAMRDGHFKNQVVNVGSDDERTIASIANLVIQVLKSDSKVNFVAPLKEGDMARRRPDITKMRSILGRELVPLEEGIQRVAYFLKTGGRL